MFGNAQPRQSPTGDVVAKLRQAISARAQAPASEQPPPLSTELSIVDAALQGGLPRGKLIEIVGGAGKMAFTLLALAAATQRGELCAFVDCEDTLDVKTAERVGVQLERLLWVRALQETETTGARKDKEAASDLKAVDLLLGAGGFALVVLAVSRRAAQAGGWRTGTAWPRLIQRCEKARASLLIVAEQAVAGSFAAATLRCAPGEAVWQQAPGGRLVLCGQRAAIEVVRSRLGPPRDAEPLPLLKTMPK